LARRPPAITPRKGEIRLQHTRHFIDVLLHCVDFRRVFDQGELELEACKHGAQIVRHPGKHRRTLFHRTLDTGLHLNESGGCTPHFTCAAWTEVRHLTPFTETLCGISQPKDRLDLIAQENDGDCEQYRRGANHPKQENFGVGDIGRAAPREHPHHRVSS
jgi:hypothetical protein